MVLQSTQGRRAVQLGCRPERIRRIHSHFRRLVQDWPVMAGATQDVREGRALMAAAAAGFVIEDTPATLRSLTIDSPTRRLWRLQAQLILEERAQFRRDEI